MSVCAYKEVFLLLLSRLKVTESGLQTDFRNPMQLSLFGVPTVFACQLNSVLSFLNSVSAEVEFHKASFKIQSGVSK